jgi:hypothetical protein
LSNCAKTGLRKKLMISNLLSEGSSADAKDQN